MVIDAENNLIRIPLAQPRRLLFVEVCDKLETAVVPLDDSPIGLVIGAYQRLFGVDNPGIRNVSENLRVDSLSEVSGNMILPWVSALVDGVPVFLVPSEDFDQVGLASHG